MPKQALLSRVAALPGTFLGEISETAQALLLSDSSILEVAAGDVVFSAKDADRSGIVLEGIAQTYLHSLDGRVMSVRYAHAGSLVGSLNVARIGLSVRAVIDCTIAEIDPRRYGEAIVSDGAVGLALVREMARRLNDTYATLAANTFGTMRERVARQLLDTATDSPHDDCLVAPITQQALADGVGTVREVVARVLREFRDEGLVATGPGHIELLDPDALAAIVARWRSG
jgi:CRP/FNR family transcriptional regulator